MRLTSIVFDPAQPPQRQHQLRQIPPAGRVDHAELKAALVAWEQALEAEREARQAHVQLEQERPAAEGRDEEALANWIAGGRPGREPGGKHVAAHDRKTDEARRQAGAARILLERAFEAVISAFEAHGDAWEAELDEQRDKLRAAMGDLVDGWERLWNELQRTSANLALARGAANAARPTSVYAASFRVPLVHDGSVIQVADVLAGLRELGAPAAPKENVVENIPIGHTPPSKQPFAGRGSQTVAFGPRRDPQAVQEWVERDEAEARGRGAALSQERRQERLARAGQRRMDRDIQRDADREAAEAV